jgi:hypothetical protein
MAYGPAVASAAPQGKEEAYVLTLKVTERSRKLLRPEELPEPGKRS